MLNVDETVNVLSCYKIQRDLYIKIFIFSLAIFIFLDILRGQIAEISLLQLIPGFYFSLVFTGFSLLIIFSDLTYQIPYQADIRKKLGGKTNYRLETRIQTKSSIFLYYLGLIGMFNIILPLSLDSFNNFGEKTVENLWPFEQLNYIETNLVVLLNFLFQVPLITSGPFYSESQIRTFPVRDYIFLICILAGIITPTIDIPTQLSLITIGILFYFFGKKLIFKDILVFSNKIF